MQSVSSRIWTRVTVSISYDDNDYTTGTSTTTPRAPPDFHMLKILLIAVHAFARYILISLSVDETLLPRYMNLSTNFPELLFRVEISPSWLKHMYCFVCIHMETNASSCLLQAMQQGFNLDRWICKKCYIICIVYIHNSFCGILSASCFFSVKQFSFIRSIDVQST